MEGAMITLVKGTIENVPVDVADVLHELTTLDGIDVVYNVRNRSGADWLVDLQPISTNADTPLIAYCLIDSTPDEWDTGIYQIFLTFDLTPEHPKIGPIEFKLAHDHPEVALDTAT